MKPHERFYYLTFHDVNIESSISWEEKEDTIAGFHNTTETPKSTFASKATVFMVRGITAKWKQAIAFYLNEGSMSGVDIAKAIKSMYRKQKNARLRMLATVSDQGSTNSTLIEYLQNATKRECALQKKEHR